MALDMRALYYIGLAALAAGSGNTPDDERTRGIENCLNQNFTIISNKITEWDARLEALESALNTLSRGGN